MKIIKSVAVLCSFIFFCCLDAQYNGLGGSQGIRQQVVSFSDICQSELDAIGSKVDVADTSIISQLDTIGSKIDSIHIGSSCVATPITTTTTISVSGSYYLANNIAGDLAITGTGITFNLGSFMISGGTNGIVVSGDDVVIKNGTVCNAADSGIKIVGGSRCVLEQIISTSNTSGFYFSSVVDTTVSSCSAIANTFSGFFLFLCTGNVLLDCQALDNGSTTTAYGFFSSGGQQNTFKNCCAKNTASSGYAPLVAAGFRFRSGESASEMCKCCASNTHGNALLYGMLLDSEASSTIERRSFYTYGDGREATSVSWLAIGGKFYVAASDQPSSGSGSITVNEFDPLLNTLNQVANFTIASTGGIDTIMSAVAWYQIGSDNYLAIGGLWGDTGDLSTIGEVGILKFDPILPFSSRLTLVADFQTSTPYVEYHGLDWLTSGTRHFLATGNPPIIVMPGLEPRLGAVQVLEFNATTSILTLAAEFATGPLVSQYVYSVAWQEIGIDKYLAVGCQPATGGWGADDKNVRILKFDVSSTPTLLEQASLAYVSTSAVVQQVAWHHYIDGNYYLAVAGNGGTGVLEYNATTSALSLGPVAFADHASGAVVWIPGIQATPESPSITTYFATSLNGPGDVSDNIRIYSFTPSAAVLDSTFTYSSPEGIGSVIALAYASPFIAVGGDPFNGPKTRQLQVFDFTSGIFDGGISCVLKDNTVYNVLGVNGIGYSLDACQNLFIDNAAYNNGTDYQFTSSCSGQNIRNDIVALESALDVVESKFDACCTNMSSNIDWIITYLMTH